MSTLNYHIQPDGLLIESVQGRLGLTVYSSRIVRVRYTLRSEFNNQPSRMVIAQPEIPAHFQVRETPDCLVLVTSDLTIEIEPETLAFTWRDSANHLLTREPARGGKTLEPVDVVV